jgi:ankyrin repeat protein
MKAAENGNMENCITLLRNACDPFIMDSKGRTADIFAEINHSDSQLLLILR